MAHKTELLDIATAILGLPFHDVVSLTEEFLLIADNDNTSADNAIDTATSLMVWCADLIAACEVENSEKVAA